MYANHKKVSRINGKKIYIYIFIAVVLSLLMIPAVSFASNTIEEHNENLLIDQSSKNTISDDISTNPVVKQNNIERLGDESNYLCFKPHNLGENVTITIEKDYEPTGSDLQYSDDLISWTKVFDEETPAIASKDISFNGALYFRGDNPNGLNNENGSYLFSITKQEIDASGSVMSLIDNGTGTILEIPNPYCFFCLFSYSDKLITSPSLPATILKERCYSGTFGGCTGLVSPPEIIPAEGLASNCCERMFSDCTSLNSSPILPCLNLASQCYKEMFFKCSSLLEAPELPATVLNDGCYNNMFSDSGITKAPFLPATSLAPQCYSNMFEGCQDLTSVEVNFTNWNDSNNATFNWLKNVPEISSNKFYCPDSLDKTTRDVSHIPNNWQVIDITNARADVASYNQQYDGAPHGVTISNKYPEDGTVLYSLDGETYSETSITRTDVGQTLVYIKIQKEGYIEYKTHATINISPNTSVTAAVGAKTKYYGEEDPAFDVAFTGISPTPVLGTDYVLEREKGEDVKANEGTYEVKLYWIRDNNYNLTITNGSLQILKATDLKLVANPASKVEGSPDPTLTAHMEGLKFDDSFDPLDYNYYRIDKVTDENGNITLKPQLEEAGMSLYGQNYYLENESYVQTSTLTVYAAAGEQAFTYTTNAFNINYNGQLNEFKVAVNNPPVGMKVEYKTSSTGTYTEDIPSFKDADTYIVYFRISAPGYSTVETSQEVKINPAPATLVADSEKLYKNKGGSEPELSATLYGAVGGESLIKGTDYNISRNIGEEPGAYSVAVTVDPSTDTTKNYYIATPSAVFTILGAANTFKYSVDAYDSVYDGQEHEFRINVEDPASGYTVKYKYGESGWVDDTFKFKDFGEYTVQFQIAATGFTTVEGSKTLKIAKAKVSLVADISKCFKNAGDEDPDFSAILYGAVDGESLVKDTDYYISRAEGEDAGAYDISLSVISGTDITKNYQIQVVPAKFFILGSGDVPPVPPTPPTPDDPGTNPSFVNSIIAQTGDDNLPIVIALIVLVIACGGYIAYRKLRKK